MTTDLTLHNKPEIDILKFLACLLIMNSHLDSLYPVKYIATGGALGNAIFFFLSGYGLRSSYENRSVNFTSWYAKKIRRIYPAFLIIALYEFFARSLWNNFGITDYLSYFVWPTSAWFIGAIMLFYLFFYFIMARNDQRVFLYSIIIASIVYFLWYIKFIDFATYSIEGPYFFKWCFYFIIMLLGGYVSFRNDATKPGGIYIVLALLIMYFSFGFFLLKGYFLPYQFIMHIITLALVYKSFMIVKSSDKIKMFIQNNSVNLVITFIASLTLEIYLVQYQIYSSALIKMMAFPFNLILFLGFTLFFAYVISKLSSLLISPFKKY